MVWPPSIPPNTRLDGTAQQTSHPDDHNKIADALTELVDRFTVKQSLQDQDTVSPWLTVSNLSSGEDWQANFSVVGPIVLCEIRIVIDGTEVNTNPRLTFPSGMRPSIDLRPIFGLFDNVRTGYTATGIAVGLFVASTGVLSLPRAGAAVMSQTSLGSGSDTNLVYTSAKVEARSTFGYLREDGDLPGDFA